MYFKEDHLKLKDFVFDKILSTDFYRCFNSELSPFKLSCLKNCPATALLLRVVFNTIENTFE